MNTRLRSYILNACFPRPLPRDRDRKGNEKSRYQGRMLPGLLSMTMARSKGSRVTLVLREVSRTGSCEQQLAIRCDQPGTVALLAWAPQYCHPAAHRSGMHLFPAAGRRRGLSLPWDSAGLRVGGTVMAGSVAALIVFIVTTALGTGVAAIARVGRARRGCWGHPELMSRTMIRTAATVNTGMDRVLISPLPSGLPWYPG